MNSERELIEARGRIYSTDPAYEYCLADKSRSFFQTLLSLANDAASSRSRLTLYIEAGHPHGQSMKRMSLLEATTHLMATGLVVPSTQAPPKTESQTNDSALRETDALPSPTVQRLELDEEDFDALVSFP